MTLEITKKPDSLSITAENLSNPAVKRLLSPESLKFLCELERQFGDKRRCLLEERQRQQTKIDAGDLPDFLPETRTIREADWRIAKIPAELEDRRVEITGPPDRKMIINALNSDANVYMADFEDSLSPTWENCIAGQINLRDFAYGVLEHFCPETGKLYKPKNKTAVLMVRPRGWHLEEAHVTVDGKPMSASLFDFGVYFFLNARALIEKGTAPYFYLPKLETYLEARLWRKVFIFAERELGLSRGTIKATVLLETLPAVFQMDEILYELKDYITGLNCGRWDYIFSFIKTLNKHPRFLLPDRGLVTMDKAFLNAFSLLLIKTCHRRGAHALGGMAANIPIKNDDEANRKAFKKVRADKEREVKLGHDGTWVAHPGLVGVAREVFDEFVPEPNQIEKKLDDFTITKEDLFGVDQGVRTEEGFRENIRVGVQYLSAWLSGRGAVPLYNLMEDAATAEISRAQIWQWLNFGAKLEDDQIVNRDLYYRCLRDEMATLRAEHGDIAFKRSRLPEAIELFTHLVTNPTFENFLTLGAYRQLVAGTATQN